MPKTVKFSQFLQPGAIDDSDWVVGLNGAPGVGTNAIWPFSGGGGSGGGVTTIITQNSPMLSLGEWVRVNSSGQYVGAQGDTAQDGECIGVVVLVDGDMYTIQQAGYVTSAQAVFSGLTTGGVYFLSTTNPGAMVPTDATINNQVSRPVFVADTPTSGWVVPYRPLLVGGAIPNSGGGGMPTIPDIITIHQPGHGLIDGNWVYVSTPVGGNPVYLKGLATSLATSQVVGVVIEVIDANNFVLQFSGYISTAGLYVCPNIDDVGNVLVPSTVYYLSPTAAGFMTSVNPVLTGQISKPVFVSEQTTGTTGTQAGYVLPQRPIDEPNANNNVHTVPIANTFKVGQWVYIAGPANDAYALASAATLASAQVAGVVTAATPNQFTVQQSGWNTGSIALTAGVYPYIDGTPAAITPGTIFYLSAINPGNITATAPSAIGAISKPCYCQETSATFTGEILPQRPIIIQASGGGGGNQLIISVDLSLNPTGLTLHNIFNGTYSDIEIVGENIIMYDSSLNLYAGAGVALRYEIGGAVVSDANYFVGGILMNAATFAIASNTYFPLGAGDQNGTYTNGALITTPGVRTFNFTANIKNITSTNTIKIIEVTNLFFVNGTNTSPGIVIYTGAYGVSNSNTAALSGLNIFFTGQGLAPCTFIQGTLSVYGTAT